MPVEEGYNARVMPQAGAAMPLANPDNYGAAVFKGLGQVGDVANAAALQAYQLERRLTADREAADFAQKFAVHRQAMDQAVLELRNNPTSPDYADHVKRVQELNAKATDQLLSGITEKSVLNRAREQLATYQAQLSDGELTYAESQRVAKMALDSKAIKDTGANRIRSGADPSQELQHWYDYVHGINNITPIAREKLLRDGEQEFAIARINHLNDTDPKVALGLIDAGTFDKILTPEQIDAARSGTMVEIRRYQAEQERQASALKAQFHESVATVKAQDQQGIDVSAQLPALIQQASAIGDTSTVVELQGIARNSAFAKVWNVAAPLQRQARLQQLQAIPEEKRTQDQQAELKWLQDKSGALDARFASDPVGFVIQNGKPSEQPPALDFNNPATVQARAQWAKAMVPAYGAMSPLSKVEVDQLQTTLRNGPQGVQQVAAALGQFGGPMSRAAARQVAPGDPWLQHVVTLPQDIQRMAIEGRAARKADPNLTRTQDPDYKVAFAQTRTVLHQALATYNIADREAIIDAARDIAAYHIRQDGAAVAPGTFYRAMNEALGSVGPEGQRKGGLGMWQGHPFLVPDGLTAQDFTNRVFRFIAQHPEKAPTNPDGSPANLRMAFPVRRSDGAYQFLVGDRVVSRGGRPWLFLPTGGQ